MIVSYLPAVCHDKLFIRRIEGGYLDAVPLPLFRHAIIRYFFPDSPGATLMRESEDGVWSPVVLRTFPQNILDHPSNVSSGHSLTEPTTLHKMRWNCPHFEVVRPHEDIREAFPLGAEDPFIEVGWRL